VRVARSPADLLERGDVEAVYVATPHMLHAELARQCLEAGVPVLVEKPFGLDRTEAESVATLARERGVLCMEALWTRFLPSFGKALEIVASGRIGELRKVVADFGFVAASDPASRLWDPSQGGGCLLDIGIYPLFAARAFLGMPDRLEASMTLASTGADASCDMELAWNCGANASLHASFVESTPCIAVIEGEEGTMVLERMFHAPTSLVVSTMDGSERFTFPEPGFGYEHETAHFGRLLAEGATESPLWSLSDSLELAELLDRIRGVATRT
jgi:predicted dehydrogenase